MAERAAAAPTERSMPPNSSTNVCPRATSPTKDASRMTTVRLKEVRKFGEATLSSTHSTTRASNTPLASQRKSALTMPPGLGRASVFGVSAVAGRSVVVPIEGGFFMLMALDSLLLLK